MKCLEKSNLQGRTAGHRPGQDEGAEADCHGHEGILRGDENAPILCCAGGCTSR